MSHLEKIIPFFFELKHSLKMYHWHTKSYAQHMATDRIKSALGDLVDKYVEVYLGKYKGYKTDTKFEITITNYTEKKFLEYIEKSKKFMIDFTYDKKDSDLANIRDEILAELNVLTYLFKLK